MVKFFALSFNVLLLLFATIPVATSEQQHQQLRQRRELAPKKEYDVVLDGSQFDWYYPPESVVEVKNKFVRVDGYAILKYSFPPLLRGVYEWALIGRDYGKGKDVHDTEDEDNFVIDLGIEASIESIILPKTRGWATGSCEIFVLSGSEILVAVRDDGASSTKLEIKSFTARRIADS